MIELLASAIVIHGNADGVWSPSHPELYPPPIFSPQLGVPSVVYTEERYIPETPMTDGNENPIFPHRLR
jgi:hypothetical protein